MPADIAFVFSYMRRLGYSKRKALELALWCIDPSQPAPGWTH